MPPHSFLDDTRPTEFQSWAGGPASTLSRRFSAAVAEMRAISDVFECERVKRAGRHPSEITEGAWQPCQGLRKKEVRLGLGNLALRSSVSESY